MDRDATERLSPVWAGPALLLATGLALVAWTWGGWADPLVDAGRELYVAWRLSMGDALYTDVAWFNGPLSAYWNALLFRAFGPGINVLVVGNVLVLGATVAMAYSLVARLADRLTATVAGLVFLMVFAFGQYVGIANYNWIVPYSHEATHGVALAIASLAALERWRRSGSRQWLVLGGVALGLCALTKAEMLLAGAVGGALLVVPRHATGAASRARVIATALMAMAAPILATAILLGPSAAIGAWPHVLAGEVSRLEFYREGAGLNIPGPRIAEAVAWLVVWCLAVGAAVASAWLSRGTKGPILPAVIGAGTVLIALLVGDRHDWGDAVRPLMLVMAGATIALSIAYARGIRSESVVLALALAGFALALLLKMFLYVRVAHYGFVLALPAALGAVTVLVGWAPVALERRGIRGDVFRACVLALLAVFAGRQLETTSLWMARKTEWVSEGRDRFRADSRGALVSAAVARVQDVGPQSVAVLPEGVMINYLSRTRAPTSYVTFLPPEEIFFGDDAWVEGFRASPPDLVFLVPKDVSEYGLGPFGHGFGRSLSTWIDSTYVESDILTTPSLGFGFGISVLTRAGTSGGRTAAPEDRSSGFSDDGVTPAATPTPDR